MPDPTTHPIPLDPPDVQPPSIPIDPPGTKPPEDPAPHRSHLHVEKLFLSAMGLSFKTGLTYTGISDVVVKRAMLKCASRVYLLADSTKIEKQSFASLGDLNVIHTLITDKGIDPRHRDLLEKQKIEVVIAS